MDTDLLWQYVVIAAAVLVSTVVVIRKRAPGLERRVRGALAVWLVRAGRPARLQRLGRAIAPPAAAQGGACGGCDSCATPRAKQH